MTSHLPTPSTNKIGGKIFTYSSLANIVRKLMLLLLLIVIIKSDLHSQIIFTDTGEESTYAEIRTLFDKADSTLRLKSNGQKPGRADILEINDQKYLLPDGYFDVYLWQNQNWVNLYKGRHFGYNYQARKFVINGTLYSLGGKGFWNEHGHLIAFDKKTNEWELIPSTKELPAGISYFSPDDQELYLITANAEWAIQPTQSTIGTPTALRKEFHNLQDNFFLDLSPFETDSFLLLCGGKPTFLIHKASHRVFSNNILVDKTMRAMQMGANTQIRGNEFRVFNPLDSNVDTLSQENLFSFFNIDAASNLAPPLSKKYPHWAWVPAIVTLVFSAFLVYRKQQKKESRQPEDNLKLENPMVSAIISHRGQIISADELDILLDIKHITSNETQRFRRAQLIKQINKEVASIHGQLLIQRVPDPEDGRRFLYKITEINAPERLAEHNT